MNDVELLALIEGKSIAELTEEHRSYLRSRLIPVDGFSQEQRELMQDYWLLVPSEKLTELEVLNAGQGNQAAPISYENQWFLSVQLLTSIQSPNAAFWHLRDFLVKLTIVFKQIVLEQAGEL
jgi:hypothetical protein